MATATRWDNMWLIFLLPLIAGKAVKSKTLLRKIFTKSEYLKIMQEAKASGIMNALVFHAHAAVQKGGIMAHQSIEGHNSGLTVCLELVDAKEKLRQFF